MTASVLVGLDPTTPMGAVADVALRLGRALGASLTAVTMEEEVVGSSEAGPVGGTAFKQARDSRLAEEARRRIRETADRLRSAGGQAGLTVEIVDGHHEPMEALFAQLHRHDMVVLGREPHLPKGTWWRHRRLHQTLERSPRPVISVPDAPRPGRGLIVAYDGSLQAARALEALVTCGLACLGPARVLSIGPGDAAADQVAVAAAYLSRHGFAVDPVSIAHDGFPADLIVDQIDRHAPALVAMGAYGRPTILELFLGSVTEEVVDRSAAPVLLTH